ncbi:MAG: NAD(+)/NADH kinase [Bdellovibrionales bacterium]|nr:NAD(+)/NADH kinase [Bdellovibrionales bacterium]
MQNISVYLNKKASNGSQDWRGQINNALFRSNIEYPFSETLTELHENLDRDVKNNVDAILSVGGDGTVHSIIQKLAGTDIGLLVVPGGTANDFAKMMGSSSNIKKIVQTIRSDTRKKIDLININGTFMATNGGLGFAADVAREINEIRTVYPQFKQFMKFSGKNVYSIFVAKKLLNKEINNYTFKIKSDEFSDVVDSPLILINNQPVLGGSFEVAPNTNHSDGMFNVTILTHENRLELIHCLVKIMRGQYPKDDKNIISFETKEVDIELLSGAESLPFFGDGEIFNSTKSWNIKCLPQSLCVFSPKDQIDLANFSGQIVSLT